MTSVAVIVPHYRQTEFLAACLESLLAQTRPADEILVVDSSSSETGAVMARFGAPVRHLAVPAKGVAAARNAGLAATRTDLVAFLDSDNMALPDALARYLDAFDTSPGAVLCHGSLVPIDRDGAPYVGMAEYTSEQVPFSHQLGWLIDRNRIMTDTVCAKRAVVASLGGFSEEHGVREDYDLWLRMAPVGPFQYIDAPLAWYRRHETNLSGDQQYMFDWEAGALRRLEWPSVVAALDAAFSDESRRLLAEGEVRLRRQELDLAIECFNRLVGGRQSAGALFHLAHLALSEGALNRAEHILATATDADPGDAALWNNAGVLWAIRERPEMARHSFDRALAIRPYFDDPRRNLAVLDSDFSGNFSGAFSGGGSRGWHLTRRRLRPELLPLTVRRDLSGSGSDPRDLPAVDQRVRAKRKKAT